MRRSIFQRILRLVLRVPWLKPLICDPLSRGKMTTALSLLVNACYNAYLIVISIVYDSVWYGTLAGYYLSVWLIRGGVSLAAARAERRIKDPVLLARRNTLNFLLVGCALPFLGGVLSAAVIQMAIGAYPDGMSVLNVVINALFALVKLTSALLQLVRARLVSHPVARAMRLMGLISALMSMLSLVVSIVAVYANGYTMWELVSAFGGVVCGVVIGTGGYMIAAACREWKTKRYFRND